MKSVLYIMHISWGWIKQRPQFIAEELAKNYKVDVYYRKSNHLRKGLNPVINNGNLVIRGFRDLPLERLSFIPIQTSYIINKLIWKFKNMDWDKYDYIWVTDPIIWWVIKSSKWSKKIKVIYDCMDDYTAFPYVVKYPKYKQFMEKCESDLIKEADFIICSAESLSNKLIKKYNISKKINIINNAVSSDLFGYSLNSISTQLPVNSFVYIGTISEWFDFNNIIRLLDDNQELNVVLYGPIRTNVLPSHKRLHIKGPIQHKDILDVMHKATALIMPFVVNELTEGVNPVKLYEYAYSGKPIIASRYSETEKFREHVLLYSSYEEFDKYVKDILNSKISVNLDNMREFARNNVWGSRVIEIEKVLNG